MNGDSGPDLEDSSLYFNRELSWLDFNERVLQLAEDPDVPLLERARFCSIYEDNLDEFYMVRIAGMHDQVEANVDARGADEVSARGVIEGVHERAVALRKRLQKCFEDELKPQLAEHGIHFLDLSEASASDHEELDKLFKDQVFPALTPLVIGRGRPFPYISNLSLSLVVLLRNPEKDEEVVARVKVPKELLRRFLAVGEDDTTFIPIEQLIADNLEELFPGMEIIHHSLFRVTRDTDYDVSDEAADLLQAVEEEVRRRRFGEVVRLEVSSDMEPRLRDVLIDALKITDGQVYDVEGLIGLDDLNDIVDLPGHGDLRYAQWNRVTPPQLQQGQTKREVDIFEAIREGDILVHHPYDSYTTSVERFVTQAVEDPNVLAIKQTVYRTSSDSPLVTGLIEATERGKQAVCLVELKARFDESANIGWARSLEEAGVHVVYGIPGLKTHVKCVLVARREGEGVRNYVHIGTGNYNAEDRPPLHRRRAVHHERAHRRGHRRDVQLPDGLRAAQGLRQGAGRPVHASRGDPRADRPGHRVPLGREPVPHPDEDELAARPHLHPGALQGLAGRGGRAAERPRDLRAAPGRTRRLGEHPRRSRSSAASSSTPASTPSSAATSRSVWIGSADLMPRNLYKRVELLAPVEDGAGRDQLSDILDRTFADNTSAWELDSDGAWTRLEPGDEEPRNLQDEMMRLHATSAEAAGFTGRIGASQGPASRADSFAPERWPVSP